MSYSEAHNFLNSTGHRTGSLSGLGAWQCLQPPGDSQSPTGDSTWLSAPREAKGDSHPGPQRDSPPIQGAQLPGGNHRLTTVPRCRQPSTKHHGHRQWKEGPLRSTQWAGYNPHALSKSCFIEGYRRICPDKQCCPRGTMAGHSPP